MGRWRELMRISVAAKQRLSKLHNSLCNAWQKLQLPARHAHTHAHTHAASHGEDFHRGIAWTEERGGLNWELNVYTGDYIDCSRGPNKQKRSLWSAGH